MFIYYDFFPQKQCLVPCVEEGKCEVLSSCDTPEMTDINCTDENGHVDHVSKKQKCTVCITCIGLLQYGCSSSIIQQVSWY